MDIVSMALNSVQQNSELLGLATVAQQNNDAETSEGGIGALSEHSSVVTDVSLGLGSDTCTSTIIDGSAVSSSISGNCAPVILMMDTDEIRPSTDTSVLTRENQHKPIFQNGETGNSTTPQKVSETEGICKETPVAENLKTQESSTFMNSIPVELSSSTSAASSILGSIANMIDPNAANLSNTRIVSTNTVNRTNARIVETNAITNNTLSNTHINKTVTNNTSVSIPLSSSQINTPTTMQQTVAKPRLPITLPLQKSAATITIKTPPGTSLTGPSGSMSGPLLQTILNNAEVQALMKRNPGQQITIVQVPDESLGNGNWGIQSSIMSAVNEAKKIIPMNNTKVSYGSLPVGRKRKKIEEPEEKTKPSKVTRPVKKITRSGRISRPPLYRIRDYKTILPTEEVQSGSSEDDYEDYADQTDKDSCTISDKPKNFKCENCDKSYIGQASLDRHFRQNPTHGTPLGPSPEKKLVENMQSSQTDAADTRTDKPDHQMSLKAADLNSSETSPASRLQTSIMRGRGRGMRKRRGRGRLPFYANHADKPAALWSNTESLPLDKRKQKVKELLNTFVDEDFLDVILPRLPNVLTPWELMLMKTESEESRKPNFVDIYNEYLSLVKEVKKVAQGCLTRISDDSKKIGSSDSSSSVMKLDIDNAAAANSLGLSIGLYEVKDSLMPLTRQLPSIPSKRTPPQMNEDVVNEEKLTEPLSQPVKKTKVEEIQPEKKQIQMPISKSMPSLTPLRNRPLNLKSVVTPGPIVEHPIPPGRPLPELKPITSSSDEATMVSTSLLVPVSQISLPTTVNSSPAILTDRLTSSPVLARLTEAMPQEESNEMMETLSPGESGVLAEDNTESPELPVTMAQEESNEMMETLSHGEGNGLPEDNTESAELPVTVQDQVQLLQSVDDDVSDLQLVPQVHEDVLPAVDDFPIDIMPVGSTLMQLQDGTFLVQRPDGTTMQIHAPEGMTIETIQELLTVDGAMHISDADTTDIPLESEDVAMVTGLDVNSADLSNEVAAT